MSQDHSATLEWLRVEFAAQLATVFEAMMGTRPAIKPAEAGAVPSGVEFQWQQSMPPLAGSVFLLCSEAACLAIGKLVLQSTASDNEPPEALRSTFIEIVEQSLSGLAQSLTGKFQREVTCTNGQETSTNPIAASWATITIPVGADSSAEVSIGFEDAWLNSLKEAISEKDPLLSQSAQEQSVVASPGTGAPGQLASEAPLTDSASKSTTFDLLLDVEMPVSVSFGKAQVALKEVLKLTTGSIIELNRAIAEPVDIVVNNCVIARGEVVVVEGNFGVRIQHVVSRNERLRSLQ